MLVYFRNFRKEGLQLEVLGKRGKGEDDDSPKDIYFNFYCKMFNRMSAREAMIAHPSPKSPLIFKLV